MSARHTQKGSPDTATLKQAQAEKAQAEKEKAEAEKAEAAAKEAAAKEKAEALEAEALAAKADLEALEPEAVEAAGRLRVAQLDLGAILYRAEARIQEAVEKGAAKALEALGLHTVQKWAEKVLPEEAGIASGIGWGSSPAYRALQAYRVAAVIGLEKVGATSVTALIPLHRLLALEDGEKAVQAVYSAAKGRGRKAPTTKAVEEALAEKYPKAKGSRGPGKGTGKGTVTEAEKEAAVQAVVEAVQEAAEAEAPTPPMSLVEEALGLIGEAFRTFTKEAPGPEAYAAGKGLLSNVAVVVEKVGGPAFLAAITRLTKEEAEAPEAEAPEKEAEAPKAEAPKEKGRRTRSRKAPTPTRSRTRSRKAPEKAAA